MSFFYFIVFENGDYIYKIVLFSDDSWMWYEVEEICWEYEGGYLVSIFNEVEN